MKTTDPPIIVEQEFTVSKEQLWNAITDIKEMKQWFFNQILEFEASQGFETQFVVTVGDRSFTHLWRLVEVVPFQKIKYAWRYEEYPGDSRVTFEVVDGESLKLRVTTEIIEDFPSSVPEFEWESCNGGWKYFINDQLKKYLSDI